MVFWLLPWKPTLTFTGQTDYGVDASSGLVISHVDRWDALQRNAFLSLEGLQHVLRMFLQVQVRLRWRRAGGPGRVGKGTSHWCRAAQGLKAGEGAPYGRLSQGLQRLRDRGPRLAHARSRRLLRPL